MEQVFLTSSLCDQAGQLRLGQGAHRDDRHVHLQLERWLDPLRLDEDRRRDPRQGRAEGTATSESRHEHEVPEPEIDVEGPPGSSAPRQDEARRPSVVIQDAERVAAAAGELASQNEQVHSRPQPGPGYAPLPVPDPLPVLPPPRVERPAVPSYGIPDDLAGTLPWSWAEERLATAETYWVATSRPGGHPHLMPIWAACHAGRIWLEGGVATRRARNLALEPALSVGIELPGDGAVIVEDTAERRLGVAPSLAEALVAAFAKYAIPPRSYRVDPANWADPAGGIWVVTPRVVFGWREFPADATRWQFPEG